MTSTAVPEIAPLAVRDWMPGNYLKQIQAKLQRQKIRLYSDSVISDVVRNGRSTHPIWPIVIKLAKAEKQRRVIEQQLNEEYLRSQQKQA